MEIWVKIPDTESYYVSSLGRVLNAKTFNIKNCSRNSKGYMVAPLRTSTGLKSFRVHRLVAELFLDNSSVKPMVNHKDYNRTNNEVSNLEWCTNAENMAHAKLGGRMKGGKRPSYNERLTRKIRDLIDRYDIIYAEDIIPYLK